MNTAPDKPEKPPLDNSAITLLQTINGGQCAEEMAQELRKTSLAAARMGKKATLIITLQVTPARSGACEVSYLITSKRPQPEPDAAFYFITEDGSLSRKDPRQRELAFTTIEGGRASESDPQPAAQAN